MQNICLRPVGSMMKGTDVPSRDSVLKKSYGYLENAVRLEYMRGQSNGSRIVLAIVYRATGTV